jgi:uncharacterized protein YoxC
MTMWLARTGEFLLLQTATLPDTIVTKQVPIAQGTFAQVTAIAQGLVAIAFLVLVVVLVPAAWNFRKSYKRINELLDKVYGDISPIVRHASTIADNVDYITTSLRVDVQQVNQTVALANQRLTQAMQMTERRMGELNALLGVVQREAEDVFVSTASTLRGVRVGAHALRDEVAEDALDEELDDLRELDVLDDGDDDLTDQLDGGEESDGDDGTTDDGTSESGQWRERPRVRPRATGRA